MDEGSGKLQKVSTHIPLHKREAHDRMVSDGASNGVMDKCSGKVQKAGTHASSLIVMYIAVVESHVGVNDYQPPALQNKEGNGHGKVIQRGDGRIFWKGSEGERSRCQ